MKTAGYFVILLSICFILSRCGKKTDESCDRPTNPNGDSELALLMRDMTTHLEQEKKNMDAHLHPGKMPEEHKKIKTATPTDTKQLSESFAGFAQMYLDALTAYHTSAPENHRFAYNNLVKTCISCHSNECPGPVKRIKKLMISE
jgi:hypothetical protein